MAAGRGDKRAGGGAGKRVGMTGGDGSLSKIEIPRPGLTKGGKNPAQGGV
ncbi:hypothetical protein [Erwinia amylovora]|nr:hypothetical protein [Erwinia amylovora]CBJ46060.1 hypothetical protein EAM_1385 [Erwinia amylovora ATCC 49946]CDK14915.1 hypothetical protein LA635_1291 [Erwinia amylovora LA635]CDK18283.1 hypothetical protein LA636_1291 [Erwinia amylovora LA636]CDK21652.1 hypothetical protein LA637_1292 [Erwinia amylovora LA637]MCK8293495.1 hypothetical protein [Erwinia amylovora]